MEKEPLTGKQTDPLQPEHQNGFQEVLSIFQKTLIGIFQLFHLFVRAAVSFWSNSSMVSFLLGGSCFSHL